MASTITAITSSTWYITAASYASAAGGYAQSAAALTWSGISSAASWTAYTAAPAAGQGAYSAGAMAFQALHTAGSAVLQGLSWTAFTAIPAAAKATAYAVVQIAHAIIAAPFVIARAAQTLWLSFPVQTALLVLTFVGARLAVDKLETNQRIQSLPFKGRVLARFIGAMGIAGVAASFGGLLGLTFTSYKLYAAALTLFAAMDDKTRAFLENAINQQSAEGKVTAPLSVKVEGNIQGAFTTFDIDKYTFSGDLAPEADELLTKAQNFQVRSGKWIDLGEWMTYMSPRDEGQKAYALALWMHLVQEHGLFDVPEAQDLTVRYNNVTWDHTLQIKATQADEVGDLFAQPLDL